MAKVQVCRVRCYAEMKDGYWQAFSIEYGLAAQGDSLEEVRQKLDAMIREYLTDAYGEDRRYQRQLLSRRAPFSQVLKYHYYSVLWRFRGRRTRRKIHREPTGLVFNENLPAPAFC